MGRETAAVLAVNAVCLLVIVLLVALWRRREPMTAAKLRRTLQKHPPAPCDAPPFGGSFGMLCEVLRDLDVPASVEALMQALLLRWARTWCAGCAHLRT